MQISFILRILVSALCGGLIGFERKTKSKDAGLRTHIIVAVGSCLLMILSMYGFKDIEGNDFYKVDAARIAAQVVSGIGFLGAGSIFLKQNVISGLSTAAGIWTTGAIGLTIGAGNYFLGVFVTVLIVIVQYVLSINGLNSKFAHQHHYFIQVVDRNSISLCTQFLEANNIQIVDFTFQQVNKSESMLLQYSVILPADFSDLLFVKKATEQEYILSVQV